MSLAIAVDATGTGSGEQHGNHRNRGQNTFTVSIPKTIQFWNNLTITNVQLESLGFQRWKNVSSRTTDEPALGTAC